MTAKLLSASAGIIFLCGAVWLHADQLDLANGDRLSGKVLSVSADTVVLESDVLGKINVPRQKVARLAFGTNAVAPVAAGNVPRASGPTNLPAAGTLTGVLKTNADVLVALRQPGADTNVIRQIREQMLAGSPEAASKYDELVNGLLTGKMNMDDLRREAQASADQLWELKRDLGPEAGDSLDAYLKVLDQFLKESAAKPASAAPAAKSVPP